MSTHLPLRIARPLRRQCLLQPIATRPFSTTFPLKAHKTQKADAALTRSNFQNQTNKAPSTLRSEQLASGLETIDDIGLLPGTFVRRLGEGPSLFRKGDKTLKQAVKDVFTYNWKWAIAMVVNQYGLFYFKWWMKQGTFKSKPKIQHSLARAKAKEFYEKLYSSFAKKDEKTLAKFCLSGILSNLNTRIAARPSNMRMTWEPQSISRPLIVSSRAMPIPSEGTDSRKAPTAIQQVVFKIKSRQRLVIEREDLYSSGSAPSTEKLPWSPDGAHEAAVEDEVRPDVHEKRVVEYIVLQRKYWKGEMEPWKVWGFADPTTLETLRKDEEWTEKSNAWEAQANV